MPFRRTPVIIETTPAADGSTDGNLSAGPLSFLQLRIALLNDTANTKTTLAQMLGAMEKIEVFDKGASIVSINALDLFALNCAVLGREPWQGNEMNVDNATRFLELFVPFGRQLYSRTEGLPQKAKGDYTVRLTYDIDDTAYDDLIIHLDEVIREDLQPEAHLKYTTKTITGAATGLATVSLARANQYLGLLFFATTVPTGTAWTATLESIKVKLNDTQAVYQQIFWEELFGLWANRLSPAVAWGEAIALENSATAYTQNADTNGIERIDSDVETHAYMDFDPLGDLGDAIDSAELNDFDLEIDYGDTNAARLIPVERVRL